MVHIITFWFENYFSLLKNQKVIIKKYNRLSSSSIPSQGNKDHKWPVSIHPKPLATHKLLMKVSWALLRMNWVRLRSLNHILMSFLLFARSFVNGWHSPGGKGACLPISLDDKLCCGKFNAKFFPSLTYKKILLLDQFDQFLPFLHQK